MTESREEVIDSIVMIANHLNLPSYNKFVTYVGWTLPELVKMIVYDMFLKKFSYDDASRQSHEVFKAFAIIECYARELENNGFVEFNQ